MTTLRTQSDQPTFRSGVAEVEPNVRLNFVTAGDGADTIVLIHGWPQTWWEWRYVIQPLADKGFRVVAVDYRGAGGSSKPKDGYDKFTMARDIFSLLTKHLGIESPIQLVGHDLGMLVAYGFARQFPSQVERLVLMEAPIPGTRVWNDVIPTQRLGDAKLWHFYFHNAWNDVADLLTYGRERQYIAGFYNYLAHDQEAIGPAEADHYAASYAAPGAMRAGFGLYRAFDKDAEDNRASLKKDGRLKMPVLGMGGTSSFYISKAEEMLGEVAEDVTIVPINSCGHWIAEEQPDVFVSELLKFLGPAKKPKKAANKH
jgi:pimeloyl-ACP methyl ester carboxylesterase